MIPELPAFIPGAPGGPEILVLLFILFVVVVPIAVVAIVVVLLIDRWGGSGDDGQRAGDAEIQRRLAALERDVERLKERIEDE